MEVFRPCVIVSDDDGLFDFLIYLFIFLPKEVSVLMEASTVYVGQ